MANRFGKPITKGALFRLFENAVVDRYDFQFNPSSIREVRGVDWNLSEAPGQYLPSASFNKIKHSDVSLRLLLHGLRATVPAAEFVKRELARLELFVSPGPLFNDDFPQFVSPGRARLVYGPRVQTVVVEEIAFEYLQYNSELEPIVAVASLRLKEVSGGLASDVARLDAVRTNAGF